MKLAGGGSPGLQPASTSLGLGQHRFVITRLDGEDKPNTKKKAKIVDLDWLEEKKNRKEDKIKTKEEQKEEGDREQGINNV